MIYLFFRYFVGFLAFAALVVVVGLGAISLLTQSNLFPLLLSPKGLSVGMTLAMFAGIMATMGAMKKRAEAKASGARPTRSR